MCGSSWQQAGHEINVFPCPVAPITTVKLTFSADTVFAFHRDTPTSAGPNSFNKGKHGFSDNQKLWERNIKSHLGNIHDQENN